MAGDAEVKKAVLAACSWACDPDRLPPRTLARCMKPFKYVYATATAPA